MAKHNQIVDTIDECITNGVKNNILHLSAQDDYSDGRTIRINGNRLVNFASYSYLGLETDARLKAAGIDAFQKYGSQFGSSRAYVSVRLYEELENLFARIFGAPVLIAPSTTLAHMAAIPVLVRDEDVVILDQHVHASIQTTVKMLRSRGIPVELLRHNSLEKLEDRIKELRQKYRKVWYMLDGVYSMYGDFAPLKDLYQLMNKYQQFNCYVDDAHGMSWTGSNGSGYVMSQIPLHPQMILLTSLNKAFAGSGGAIIFPDKEQFRKVRTCGGTLIFSTPIQPPMLGVDCASALIHLSSELPLMQEKLQKRIQFTQALLEKYKLPVVSNNGSPIFYIGTGLPRVGYNMVNRTMKEGYYMSIGLFPAVAMKSTGLRFCLNLHQSLEDIENMIAVIAYHYPLALSEEGRTRNDVQLAFKLPLFEEERTQKNVQLDVQLKDALTIEYVQSVRTIEAQQWNSMLGSNGSFDWNGLCFLENTFRNNPEKENNWDFHYVIVRDSEKKPILATFLTTAWCKDDIFSPASVSEEMEKERQKNPYHLCSRVLMMGSLLTEGNHLYIDRSHCNWREALRLLLEKIASIQIQANLTQVNLRDFEADDIEIRDILLGEGFVKVDLPDAHVFSNLGWATIDEYMSRISIKSRKHVKKYISPYEEYYDVELVSTEISEEEVQHLYSLYLNVKDKGFELNTFSLPVKAFKKMILDPNWEVLQITLKEQLNDRPKRRPIAVMFSFMGKDTYSPVIVGLDYFYLFAYKNYRQILFQAIKRASILDKKTIFLGFTASIEKQRLGAENIPKVAYVQMTDGFNMQVLEMTHVQERSKERERIYSQHVQNKQALQNTKIKD